MALPLIAVGILGRFLLQRGGLALAKQYAKKNGKSITQALIKKANNANKFKTVKAKNLNKGRTVTVKQGTSTKKITANKNPSKRVKKKDSFDEQLKKKEGTKKFNKNNKEATKTNIKPNKDFYEKSGFKLNKSSQSKELTVVKPRKLTIKKEPKLSAAQIKMLDRVNKPKSAIPKLGGFGKSVAATAAVGTGLSFLPTGGAKTKTKNTSGKGGRGKKTNTSTNTILSNKDLKNKQNMQKNKAYSLDDMLDSKQVRSAPSSFGDKKSKPKGSGTFGANISFTGKDIKSLRENARKLSSQIDRLDITGMQKRRLKDELNTRKNNMGMGESYIQSFNIIKNKVKNKKFN
jgi:hypothetical protein|tara:strand:- start:5952 stop:6989 length:1038 start_codon:yes stop_codon:yes gene_type:complete